MIRKIVVLVIVLSSLGIYAQKKFTGKIFYDVEVKGTLAKQYGKILKEKLGSTSVFYYSKGHYFQTYENGEMEFDFVDVKKKIYYTKNRGNDTIYAKNATIQIGEKLLSMEKVETKERVLDKECKELKLKIGSTRDNHKYDMSFIYSEKIKIKGARFKGFKRGFFDVVYENCNSIPIKFSIGTPEMRIVCTATKIEESKKLDVLALIEEKIKLYPVKNK